MKSLNVLFFVLSSVISCETPEENMEKDRESLQLKLDGIKTYIASANCAQDAQCEYIAYGNKACGGPSGYLVFSSNLNVEELEELIADYTQAEKEFNAKYNQISDCAIVLPPENIECIEGKCEIVSP